MSLFHDAYFQIIQKALKCPLCKHYFLNNIYICKCGHYSICTNCVNLNPKCSKCDSDFGVRNYTLEKVILYSTYPCKYKEDGCKVERNIILLSKHIEECDFKNYPCKIDMSSFRCLWTGKSVKIKEHILKVHGAELLNYPSNHIHALTTYVSAFKTIFKVTRKVLDDGTMINWVVQYLGTKHRAKDFIFRLEFKDPNQSQIGLIIAAECSPFEDDEYEQPCGITIALKMLSYYQIRDQVGETYNHILSIHEKNYTKKVIQKK